MKAYQITFYGKRRSEAGHWYDYEETKIATASSMFMAQRKAMRYLGKSSTLNGVKAYVEIGEAL